MSVSGILLKPAIASGLTFAKRSHDLVPLRFGNQPEARSILLEGILNRAQKPLPKTTWDVVDQYRFLGTILVCSLFANLAHLASRLIPWFKRLQNKLESWAIFQSSSTASIQKLASTRLREEIGEERYFTTPQGNKIHYWYVPAKGDKPTVLYAHGNFGNMNHREYIIDQFTKAGYGFMIFDPRGYGNSTGQSSEEGMYEDYEAASRHLEKRHRIPLANQIAAGESLGGGIVTHVAQTRKFKAVILCATFTSIPDVFRHLKSRFSLLGWFLPSEDKVQQQFRSLDKIANIKSPLVFIHGDFDDVVPMSMTRRLFQEARQTPLKCYITVRGAEHCVNAFPFDQLIPRLGAFIQKVDALKTANRTTDSAR